MTYGYVLNIFEDDLEGYVIRSIYLFERRTGKLAAVFDFASYPHMPHGHGVYIDFDIEIQKFQN